MGLPDTFKVVPGTPVVVGQPSASGVTVDCTLNGLADGTARASAVIDFGTSWDVDWALVLVFEPTSAPTAGNRVDVFLAGTHSTSYYPAGLTGSDAAWPGDSNEDEWLLQVGAPIGSLIATNDAAVQVQGAVQFRPSARYGVVIVDNNLGVALKTDGTPSDNKSRVILIPLALQVVD